jgi:hypothetical protein
MNANKQDTKRTDNDSSWERKKIRYDELIDVPLTFFVGFQSVFFVFSILFSLYLNHSLVFRSADELPLDPMRIESLKIG